MGNELTNKTLRTRHSYQKCVLLVQKDGVVKYISKGYGRKNCWSHTVLLNKAMMFDSVYAAENFAERVGLCNYRIQSVEITMKLSLY